MHRFILTLVVMPSVAVMINGCGSVGGRPSKKQGSESKGKDSILVRGPSNAVADTANKPIATRVQSGNAVTNTVFTPYDAKMIHAIQQHWSELLGDRAVKNGEVVIEFRLHADGRVSDVRVAQNTAGEMEAKICQNAILQAAPFEAWPPELRHSIAVGYREVRFTFYLN